VRISESSVDLVVVVSTTCSKMTAGTAGCYT